jgi:SAM-dependent methyltransferase
VDEQEIRSAYDGSSVAFRALSALGWGELINLGYYPALALPQIAFGLAPFQRRLAERALALLAPRAGERVLDAGCGRGFSTALIARTGARAHGVDLLAANVARALERFGSEPGVSFAVGDVTRLPAQSGDLALGDGSLDAVHCLEVAFHFGAKGRRDFLEQCWRVLRPGGRLVLVDFVWRDDRPDAIELRDARHIVRDTWRFTEFEPLERYRSLARGIGFREAGFRDWTGPVIDRFQRLGSWLARTGSTALGRALLSRVRPGLADISPDEWQYLVQLMHAHDEVRSAARYVAFLFEKPAA